MANRYVTTGEICNFLSISRSTFYRRFYNHPDFPKPLRLGEGFIRYQMSDVTAFFEDSTGSVSAGLEAQTDD